MRRQFPTTNIVLFALTVATTLFVGAHLSPAAFQKALAGTLALGDIVRAGLPYSLALLSILVCHELAHFLAARRNRVDATLPYFVPVPVSIGTLGAFIRIRSPLPSRSAVLDIGASGPIAGFLVALPLLFWGFATSEVKPVPPLHLNAHFGSPFAALAHFVQGKEFVYFRDSPQVMGDSVITWLAARLTHGVLPPGHDIHVNGIAFAAWVGMFVTALNLIPIGQLDGGHVLFALFGRHASRAMKLLSYVLLGLGVFASWTWLLWWVLLRFVLGTGHPPTANDEPLDPARRAVGVIALVILAITFVPVPFS